MAEVLQWTLRSLSHRDLGAGSAWGALAVRYLGVGEMTSYENTWVCCVFPCEGPCVVAALSRLFSGVFPLLSGSLFSPSGKLEDLEPWSALR